MLMKKFLTITSLFALTFIFGSCARQNPAAQNAIKNLRRMASVVEVGTNFQEYSKRVVDLKADVDEEIAQLPEGELKQEIKLAVDAYADARTIWEGNLKYETILFRPNSKMQELQLKYSLPAKPSTVLKDDILEMERSLTLSLIWEAARKHIERATQLNQ